MVSFGPPRTVIPNQNLGNQHAAQRRLAEVAGRAAQKTRVSVSVDAWPARLYLRNPRGTIPCPCTSFGSGSDAASPGGGARVTLDGGEYDDIGAVESGYPRGNERDDVSGTELPAGSDETDAEIGESIQRLLLGNGRRCGICWGTGWLDGHRLWGGNRRVLCVLDAPGVELVDGDVQVDHDSPSPAMIGPGTVTWRVRINHADRYLDALRVRDGLLPAGGGYVVSMSDDDGVTWTDPLDAMRDECPPPGADAQVVRTGSYQLRVVLQAGARLSHVEIISRSEPLVNLQLPQVSQVASAELISPFLNEEFELDPVVGFVERGSIMDVQPRDGRIGQVWLITDVTIKRTAAGQIFGVIGNARSAQPTDTIACVSATDALRTGLQDRGYATRGLESTGMGVGTSVVGGDPENDVASARRGSPQRLGGGAANETRSVIVLSDGEY